MSLIWRSCEFLVLPWKARERERGLAVHCAGNDLGSVVESEGEDTSGRVMKGRKLTEMIVPLVCLSLVVGRESG